MSYNDNHNTNDDNRSVNNDIHYMYDENHDKYDDFGDCLCNTKFIAQIDIMIAII